MADQETQRIRLLFEAQTQSADRALRKSANELARLERQLDPVSAAAQKYVVTETRLKKQLDAGSISVERHTELMRRASAAYDVAQQKATRTAAAMSKMGTATTGLTGFMARNRTVMQQTGFQVGDFAVQVAGGTSAMVAFSQQGSQLLGVFGAWGAVAGAAVATLGPLAASFLSAGDSADSFKDALEAVNDSLQRLEDREGGVGRALALREAELDAQALVEALQGIVDSSFFEPAITGTAQVRRNLRETREDARGLNDRLAEAANAVGYKAQAEALREANSEIIEAFGGIENMDRAQADVVENVYLSIRAYEQLGAEVSKVADQVSALAFAGAQRAESFGYATPLQDAISGFEQGGAGLSFSSGGSRSSSRPPGSSGRSGGGRSASSQFTAEQREVKRIIEQTRTEVEKYNAEAARLNDLHSRGKIDADTFERAMGRLDEQLDDTKRASLDLSDTFGQTFASIITGADSASNALRGLGNQILNQVVSTSVSGFAGAVGGAIGDSGALGKVGNAFLSSIGARAIGGPVSRGTPYLVGERGPEVIVPRQNGTVNPGVGGDPVTVNVTTQQGMEANVTRSNGGRTVDVVVRGLVNEMIATGRADGALGGRFGLRPKATGG